MGYGRQAQNSDDEFNISLSQSQRAGDSDQEDEDGTNKMCGNYCKNLSPE